MLLKCFGRARACFAVFAVVSSMMLVPMTPARAQTVDAVGAVAGAAATEGDAGDVDPNRFSKCEKMKRRAGIALLIGVKTYSDKELPNLIAPINDVEAVGRLLQDGKTLGDTPYCVVTVVDEREHTNDRLMAVYQEFLAALRPDDVALFYFAGHGFQYGSENYLMTRDSSMEKMRRLPLPTDFRHDAFKNARRMAKVAADTRDWALGLSDLLQLLLRRKNSAPELKSIIGLFVIDACRTYETGNERVRSTGGLIPSGAEKGTFLLYSAGPGERAKDQFKNSGRSPFVTALLNLSKRENFRSLSLADLAQDLRDEVSGMVHSQRPSYVDVLDRRRDIVGNAHRVPLLTETRTTTTKLVFDETDRVSVYRNTPGQKKSVDGLKVMDHFRDCSLCPKMVVQDKVTLRLNPARPPAPFVAFGQGEVTRREYLTFEECTKKNGGCVSGHDIIRLRQTGDLDLPMTGVRYEDAQAYVDWLNALLKEHYGGRRHYRLMDPTEWTTAAALPQEKSPRASDICRYANGADRSMGQAMFVNASCSDQAAYRSVPAGSFEANDNLLHNMIGNVAEWVSGCADGSGDPRANGDACYRVAMGGSWRSRPEFLTPRTRLVLPDGHSRPTVGFRVAVDIDPPDALGQ